MYRIKKSRASKLQVKMQFVEVFCKAKRSTIFRSAASESKVIASEGQPLQSRKARREAIGRNLNALHEGVQFDESYAGESARGLARQLDLS
ncbi:hypothetical protein EXIGLDRAFT_722108 [Exidia glandulosa HHB12029]|uniref:Uncharacterized protein n=1 Tax=Exidia glandulosa HHB12029 TaxID=1314781 RepID=A0A166A6E4_EXIGL|nr:hypothetical protein EXIGLDRAFT_722108 [Exidia glandulosa HHB12029]